MARPVIGVKQLHLARLSPQVIRILKRQSYAQANREAAPQIAALSAQRGAINQSYRQEVGSARGAVGLEQAYLGKALRQAKGSGLQGRFLSQYTNAIGQRIAGSAGTIPFLTADAAVTRAKDQRSLSSDILKARADALTQGAQNFGAALTTARGHAASAVADQRSGGTGGLSDADKRKLQSARIYLRNFLNSWAADDKVPKKDPATGITKMVPLQSEFPNLSSKKTLNELATQLAASEGVDAPAAQLAIQQTIPKFLQHRRRQQARASQLPRRIDPGRWQLSGPGAPLIRHPHQRIDPGLQQLLGQGR